MEFTKITTPTSTYCYGFLSPEGELYSCAIGKHLSLAKQLCEELYGKSFPANESEVALLNDGYVRVNVVGAYARTNITPEQKSWLEAYYKYARGPQRMHIDRLIKEKF